MLYSTRAIRTQSSLRVQRHILIIRCCRRIGAEMELPYVSTGYWKLFNEDHTASYNFASLYLAAFTSRVCSLEQAECEEPSSEQPWESATLRRDGAGGILEHNPLADYILWGQELEGLNLYDFIAHYATSPRATTKVRADATFRQRALRRVCVQSAHPLSQSHWSIQRSAPSIPVSQGRTIPPANHTSPEIQERYAKNILMLFKPWRKLADLKTGKEIAGSGYPVPKTSGPRYGLSFSTATFTLLKESQMALTDALKKSFRILAKNRTSLLPA